MLCILYLNIRMSIVSQLFGKYQYIAYIKSLAILVRAINTFFLISKILITINGLYTKRC